MTSDVSPYLQRPVRTLEEVILEAEQQRLEQARESANSPFADRSKLDDASAAPPSTSRRRPDFVVPAVEERRGLPSQPRVLCSIAQKVIIS